MRKIVVFAGLVAVPACTERVATPGPQKDERLDRVRRFFDTRNCPLSQFAADFLMAADENDLDWRLLPSISMVESSGGKRYMNRNVFGWNSCRERFASVRTGIHAVAARLGKSDLYREKGLDQILKTYNPRPEYARRVKAFMRTLGPLNVPYYAVPYHAVLN
jgi:hypothetical protein